MPPAPKKPDPSAANKERNEYIPSFIAKKPFYVDDDADAGGADDYLEHQRLHKTSENDSFSKWYDRGRKKGPAATKYRKGACENCGAMTHKAKDCLSRPRKAGAKWTGRDIQADEVVQDVQLGWDAKRDRWNGYDPTEYKAVIDEYNELEGMKSRADGEKKDDEGAKYEEETDMGRQQSTSTRNLRIREDTAKYLLNLDLDSAKYDPKTRSMEDGGASSNPDGILDAQDGFAGAPDEASEFEKAQRYAWETQERGDKNKLHLQANPTHGEYFRRKEKEEAEAKKTAQRKALLEKYGTQDSVQKDAASKLAVTESEQFVEYDETGAIKGAPKTHPKSKYPEDVFTNNHTSVWGSWWADFQWGYACCHSTVKNSYCTGEEGKQAHEEANRLRTAEDMEPIPKEIAWKDEESREEHVPNATEKDEKHARDNAARKRTIQEMKDGVTDEDMEQYRRKRQAANDPMAKMLGTDELIP